MDSMIFCLKICCHMQGKPYDVALVADGENLGDEAQYLSNDIEGEKVDELEHAGLRLVIRDVRQFRHQSLYSLIEGADQPSQIPVDTGSYRQRCRKGRERDLQSKQSCELRRDSS